MGQNKKSREGLKEEEVSEGLCVMWKKKNVGNFHHLVVLYQQANYPTTYVSLNVRTYVDHIKNICNLELANHLTKCTLLVIG